MRLEGHRCEATHIKSHSGKTGELSQAKLPLTHALSVPLNFLLRGTEEEEERKGFPSPSSLAQQVPGQGLVPKDVQPLVMDKSPQEAEAMRQPILCPLSRLGPPLLLLNGKLCQGQGHT